MEYSVMDQYWIWLSAVEGVGPRRFYQILSLFTDPRDVWENVRDNRLEFLGPKVLASLRKARDERFFFELFARLEQAGVRALTRTSDDYPLRLTRTVDAPPTLYVKGEADLNAEKAFAIVGSRRCTREGRRAAQEFRPGADPGGRHRGQRHGAWARIPAAHRGRAWKPAGPPSPCWAAARTWCISCFTKRLLETGGAVVSEYLPGMPPLSSNFPARNRIISGISRGVLIVEGAKHSGAMITVGCALDQGRDVFAVPGSIYSPMSATPNQLIVDGAYPALSPWEILEHYGWSRRLEERPAPHQQVELSEVEKQAVEPLRQQSLTLSELANITGMSTRQA